MVQGVTPRRGTAHGDVCAVKSLSLDSSDTGRASTNSGSVYNFPKHRTGLLCYFPPKNRVFLPHIWFGDFSNSRCSDVIAYAAD